MIASEEKKEEKQKIWRRSKVVFCCWFYFFAVEDVFHGEGDSLIDGVAGDVEADEFVHEDVWFGVWADADAEAAIGAEVLPV